ncbi:hypothetical protein KPH14_000948 [Odynerus spinipes]|uniref:Uncharacterized protein n=1 Tax=Odynerus spinipes TaxID=1348599 RepID=A0AAD9RHV8_9HYME|nr:hypothetical protein KPH14_000948 [Odynerus spinipes]
MHRGLKRSFDLDSGSFNLMQRPSIKLNGRNIVTACKLNISALVAVPARAGYTDTKQSLLMHTLAAAALPAPVPKHVDRELA